MASVHAAVLGLLALLLTGLTGAATGTPASAVSEALSPAYPTASGPGPHACEGPSDAPRVAPSGTTDQQGKRPGAALSSAPAVHAGPTGSVYGVAEQDASVAGLGCARLPSGRAPPVAAVR
ncbi:MAG: hypothetical protein ACRDYU_02230 [Actinomycetes bacterium]